MKRGRTWAPGVALALAGAALVTACGRRKPAEVNAIVPSFSVSRTSAPLGSPIEITYTWTVENTAKKLTQDYRALVHFVDSKGVMIFEDDHVPTTPPSAWEPGNAYSYTRTKFIPISYYSGEAEVRIGLYPALGRGERVVLKGEDTGMREYRVAKMRLLPQVENTIFLVQKEGWHTPETSPQNPAQERQWTKKEAVVNFKNPRKDVVIYLEADTNYQAFPQPPVLTVSVGGKAGITVPIQNSEVFLKKIRVKAEDLGDTEWVDLRLSINQSFIPKALGINQDDRELGLLVYHLFVGEAEKLGAIPAESVVDAGPLPGPPAARAAASRAPAVKTPAVKTPPKPAPGKPAPPVKP